MTKVLTIIVSYNFEPWIHKCIPSLLDSSYPNDIIIVDNASKDNTVNIIKAQYPSVILIESNENLGFGKANNIGMEYALANGYDYVYLVNQDAWIPKDCIQSLLVAHTSDDAILSPVHFDGTEKALDRGFAEYCKDIFLGQEIQQVQFVNAAFWLIPTNLIKRIGIFSPIFYHYGEDKDFANRLKYYNIPIYIVKEAKAFHDRQGRKVTSGIDYKSEYIYHLTELCNINYNSLKAFSTSILACYKKAIEHLFRQNFHASKNYVHIASKLWNKIREAKETRKTNKIAGIYLKA